MAVSQIQCIGHCIEATSYYQIKESITAGKQAQR